MNLVCRWFGKGGNNTQAMSGLGRCIFAVHVAMVFLIIGTHGQDSRYLGCFLDLLPNRVLPNLTSCNDDRLCNNFCSVNVPYCQSSANMSVTTCLDLCARNNFVYAGVQAGTQCFCGDRTARYDAYGEVIDHDLYLLCRSNCSGDITQNCGSDFRMRVFKIGCFPFDASLNSTVSPANETFFEIGQTLTITCQDGFFLTGLGNLTCLPAGQWNLPPPSCLPDVCGAPEPPNGTRAAERPANVSSEGSEYRGGDTLTFACIDTNVMITIRCEEGQWLGNRVCLELQPTTESTEMTTRPNTSVVTETSEATSRSGMTTLIATDKTVKMESLSPGFTDAVHTETPRPGFTEAVQTETVSHRFTEEFEVSSQVTTTHVYLNSTPWEDSTSIPPVGFPRGRSIEMLWLIIIVGIALFLFVVVLFVAVLMACRKKDKRDGTINFQQNSQIPKIEDMAQMNYAYEDEDTTLPNQNGRQTSGSPIRISTLYSQREIMIENNNGSIHEYAKPVTPAYTTNQSGTVPNEYSSPVHHHVGNGEARTRSSVLFADIPEPDYDRGRRESYVELVTKL